MNMVDPAVAHIGDRKVDNTVSSKERKRSDRTIFLHSLHSDMSSGRCDNTQCFSHLILPPLHVLTQARYVRCRRCPLLRLCRSSRRRLQELSGQPPASTSTPGIRTLSIILAPSPTVEPVKSTELVTSPSTIQP